MSTCQYYMYLLGLLLTVYENILVDYSHRWRGCWTYLLYGGGKATCQLLIFICQT